MRSRQHCSDGRSAASFEKVWSAKERRQSSDGGRHVKEWQRQTPGHPAVGERRRQGDLRHHAPVELRRRAAVRAGADVDSLPPHPRRAGDARARGGRGGGRGVHALPRGALSLAGLGGARRGQAEGAPGRHARRLLRLRQRRAAAAPQGPAGAAGRHAAPEGDQRDHVGRRAHAHRHREQPSRRARQGARDERRASRPDPRLRALPGLRGPAPQDGREGQRRRPVLHAARGHPRHGAGHRSPDRRDRLRPRLRDGRLPRAGLRAHGGAGQRQDPLRRPARHAQARARSTAGRRTTRSTRSAWPTSCSTASTSRTSGTATR